MNNKVLKRLFVMLLLGLTACQPLQPGSAQTATVMPSPVRTSTPREACPLRINGDLPALYQAEMDQVLLLNDQGMVVPDETELVQWRAIIVPLTAADMDAACAVLKQSGFPYQVLDYTDTSTSEHFLILREMYPHRLGWGTYLFNPRPRRRLVIEAPHPGFDQGTENEALLVFRQTGAAALLVAGTDRCAAGPSTPGGSPPCDPSHSMGPSDVAHLERSAFQAAHEALLPCDGDLVAIQLHGNSRNTCPDVFISNATDAQGKLSDTLEESVKLACADFTSGQPEDQQTCPLVGSKNVQGAALRACPAAGERFLQIEQSALFRQKPDCLIKALLAVFPPIN